MKLRILLICLLFSGIMPAEATSKQKSPVDYVDMFIGTSNSRWMLGPYAQEPFGMIQLGPDNQGDVWMPSAVCRGSAISTLGPWEA